MWYKQVNAQVQPNGIDTMIQPHNISTISMQKLCQEGRQEEMFLFEVTTNLSGTPNNIPEKKLLNKYEKFVDVFNKVKANTLLEHRPYDCPIDLQPRK